MYPVMIDEPIQLIPPNIFDLVLAKDCKNACLAWEKCPHKRNREKKKINDYFMNKSKKVYKAYLRSISSYIKWLFLSNKGNVDDNIQNIHSSIKI